MAGKRYSAGAIFLQVVPVFADVQHAIEREAKNIDRALGDQMEKSGDKAGQRAGQAASESMRKEIAKSGIDKELERQVRDGVDGIDRALDGINTRNLGKKLRSEIKGMKSDLDGLRDVDLTVDDNLDKVRERVRALKDQIEDMRKRSKVFFDIEGLPEVYRKVAQVKKAVEDIDGTINLDVDTKNAERSLGTFERSVKGAMQKASRSISGTNKDLDRLKTELEYLGKLRVGVDISASQLHREVGEIKSELEALSRSNPEVDVRIDSGRASAELASWMAKVEAADHQSINVDTDIDTDRATRSLFRLTRSGEDASNSFRSFNGVLLAAAGAGPALIPILGAIAGGLLAIGPAAAVGAAGIGSVLIGFSGIGDALSALQSQEDQSSMTAQTAAKAHASAARSIRDAEEALADARRNASRAAEDAAERVADARKAAADAVEDALERQRDAQESYRDSVNDVRDAEEALRQAREDARGTGADIREQIADNRLAQDQALLDVFNQTVTYDATMADGSATNAEQEQARINLEQARDRLADLRKEARELAKEQRQWREEGVNGTDQVTSAQDALNDALERQQDAYASVRDAAAAVDEARQQGAENVREAIEAQNETLADNRRAIQDAQQALADAKIASDDVADSMNSQQQAVDAAFNKLGLAGRQFALFLFGLRDEFYDFRDDIQQVLLPAVQQAIEGFMTSTSGATLRDLMIDLAAGFGQFIQALSRSFQGPVWLEFFETLDRIAPRIMRAYGGAFISFLEAMASIMTTLAPFAVQFAEGLARLSEGFNQWAQSKEGQDAITKFMGYVRSAAPDVLEFVGALGAAFANLLRSLAPYGEVVLKLLTDMLDFIAQMDPKTLGAITSAILVLITASQLAYTTINLLLAGGALLTSTVGVIVFALAAIGIAVAYLWHTNEDFRDFMQDAWGRISEVVGEAWEKHLKPALAEFWDAVKQLWDEVLEPFFAWLAPLLVKFAEFYFPLLIRWWSILVRALTFTIRHILIPVFKALGVAVEWIWEHVLRPVFNFIRDHWDEVVDAMKWAWEHVLYPVFKAVGFYARELWNESLKPTFSSIARGWRGLLDAMEWAWEHVLKPVFNFIKNDALPGLEGAFEKTVAAIKKVWDGLKRVVGSPIKFVLDTIINEGLIDGFNRVAKWVGMDGFDHIPIPKWLQSYATGGVMPGYTPGRDVHQFVSPTGGRLELSGGEAVMRPEWTAAVGPEYVHQMNAIARSGGVNALRKTMGGYWMGGVLPLPGASVSSHGSSYGHPAYDINYPGYADYGAAVKAFKSGVVAQMNYIGDDSYGRWVVLNHGGLSTLYAHLSNFAHIAVGEAVKAGQTIGYVGDLGNTGTPPTSHLHFEIMGGDASMFAGAKGSSSATGHRHPSIPGWIKGLLKNPIDTIKGWASDRWSKASDFVNDSPAFNAVKRVPLELASGIKDKVMDVIPGWAKAAAGVAGKIGDKAGDIAHGVGDAIGGAAGAVNPFAKGGILPYNGTMKYDAGGYIPPGLTSVVNLTGKPEPVFTNDQWDGMIDSPGGGNIHYEPHFEGSDLGPEDVAADLNFTFRRIRRAGKYEGVGS